MANEITVANVTNNKFDLVFLFPIITPIQDIDAANVVPTPSASLPATVLSRLSGGEITALDDGTAMWERQNFTAPEGMLPAEILAKVQEMYALRRDVVQGEYATKHVFAVRVGERFDAPAV